MNYEPDEDEVLDAIIPKYVSSLILRGILRRPLPVRTARE